MPPRGLPTILFLFFLAAFFARGENGPATLGELTSGPPRFIEGPLDAAAYKKIQAQALAHPELVWFNFNWAREKNIRVPAEGVTPAFLREIHDAFAYQIPAGGDPKDAFLPKSIDVFADGYGADDTPNLGSGRAASFGRVQSKGIGRTPLVRTEDPWHSNGALLFTDAMREAVLSEIASHEVAGGANRVIAILFTGTYTVMPDGTKRPRFLVIREDPLRPAHFIRNKAAKTPDDIAWDEARVKKVLPKLADALPQPAGAPPAETRDRIRAGMDEFADRLALQFADSWARRLHHGGESVSNVMLDGGMIDFGSFTGLEGWQRHLTFHHGKPFGDITDASRWIVEEWTEYLHKSVPAGERAIFPEPAKLRERFEKAYDRLLPERMLQLTGAPPDLLREVKDDASARELGNLLVKMARAGNEEIHKSNGKTISPDTGTYDVGAILQSLARREPLPRHPELVKLYAAFLLALKEPAARHGISMDSLSTFMSERSAVLARRLPETYTTSDTWNKSNEVWERYSNGGKNRRALQQYFDTHIENNTRGFRDGAPFETVIHQRSDPELGVATRTVYDAKEGKYFKVIRLADSGGRANFFGNIVDTAALTESVMRFTPGKAGEPRRIAAVARSGPYLEYRIEVPKDVNPAGALSLETRGGRVFLPGDADVTRAFWESRPTCVTSLGKLGAG